MIHRYLLALSVVLLTVGSLNAQCRFSIRTPDQTVCAGTSLAINTWAVPITTALTAQTAGGNNHRGNMFDISATNAVTISYFDAFPLGNTTVEVYYKAGPFAGFESNPSAWTFLGSAPVAYTGGLVPVDVPVNVLIPAGQVYSFYVTSTTSAVSLNYSNGTTEGTPFSSDENITFYEGGGLEYPFTAGTGAVYRPRVWNGAIHYVKEGTVTYNYLWNTAETTANINKTPSDTTQYTVAVDMTGCPTFYDTINIAVNQLPVVYGGEDLGNCAGTAVTLAGSGAETFVWNNGALDSVSFIPLVDAAYVVTGTDANGCSAKDTVLVDVYDIPEVNAGADFNVCAGSPATLSGSGAVVYVWNKGVLNGEAFTPLTPGDYKVIGMDGNGCTDADIVHVEIDALPVIDAGIDVTVCAGAEVTLQGEGSEMLTWNNDVIDGEAFEASVAGPYVVTGTGLNGCTNTDTLILTLHALPVIVQDEFEAVCIDNGIVALPEPTPAGGTYAGTGVTGTDFDPAAGTQTITYTYTDANGCTSTHEQVLTVNALPDVTQEAFAAACSNAGTIALAGGSPAEGTYSGTGVTDNSFDPTAGTQTIAYTYTDANGCTSITEQVLTVNASPEVTHAAFAEACSNEGIVALTGGSPAEGMYSGTGVTDNSFDPTAGTQTITYTYTDANNCTDEATTILTVHAAPNTTLVLPVSSACIENGTLTLSGGAPAEGTYSGTGVMGVDFDPATAGVGMQLITYNYTDANGCEATAMDTINVTSCLGIAENAQAFVQVYPNPGNGWFTVITEAGQALKAVQIFDVQGKLVENAVLTQNGSAMNLDLTRAEHGMYFLRGTLNNEMISVRLIKQ